MMSKKQDRYKDIPIRNWKQSSAALILACAVCLFCAVTAIVSPAQTFTNLWNFNDANGNSPYGSLVEGTDGNFYGTTYEGGNLSSCQLNGCGTVFKITSGGTLTTIYAFTGKSDGSGPQAGLTELNGTFYGTTYRGGGSPSNPGQGTIFSVSPDGSTFTTLYTFSGESDGGSPDGVLLLGADGNLYGTTSQGGQGQNNNCISGGCGTIFMIAPDGGNFTTLYQFTGDADGRHPEAGLIQDPSGNFYGTTSGGGASCPTDLTCGTAFMFQTNPITLTTLHSLNGTTDGAGPVAPLVRASNGTLYGTANTGGNLNCGINNAAAGCGTIFQISGTTFSVFYTFQGTEGGGDGALPFDGLIFGTDGNLYGTTGYGGAMGSCSFAAGCGTVFSISPTGGAPKILHSFTSTDGTQPVGGLVESNSTFYGTTQYGGNPACTNPPCGTVFSLAVAANKTSTSTTAMVTPASVEAGTTSGVTLSATVKPASGSGSPTGTVTFFNGTTQVGQPEPLSGGMAALNYNTSSLAAGAYSLTAKYSGDANFASSTSSPAVLTVTASVAPDFEISANPTTITVTAPGQSGSTALTITPLGGFNQTVSFTCSGLPSGANCSFASASGGATVIISTTGSTARLHEEPFGRRQAPLYALLLPGLFGLVSGGSRKRSLRSMRVLLLLCAVGFCSLGVACGGGTSSSGGGNGGGSDPGTPPGTSTVTVTAIAGSLSHQATITLTVQ
jgi:uncharacterized repeat protein (TIGR03803 family)